MDSTTAPLTKHRVVMELQNKAQGKGVYVVRDEDTWIVSERYTILSDLWEDLGRPDQITITVRAGDHLNES